MDTKPYGHISHFQRLDQITDLNVWSIHRRIYGWFS